MESDKAQAKAAWMAALRWYQDLTDEFSQDRVRAAEKAFELWWKASKR